MSLKVLVESATDIPDNPTTLFVLLEFGNIQFATSHVLVRDSTSVEFNEEADFGIRESGYLQLQLYSVIKKKTLLSKKVIYFSYIDFKDFEAHANISHKQSALFMKHP